MVDELQAEQGVEECGKAVPLVAARSPGALPASCEAIIFPFPTSSIAADGIVWQERIGMQEAVVRRYSGATAALREMRVARMEIGRGRAARKDWNVFEIVGSLREE